METSWDATPSRDTCIIETRAELRLIANRIEGFMTNVYAELQGLESSDPRMYQRITDEMIAFLGVWTKALSTVSNRMEENSE